MFPSLRMAVPAPSLAPVSEHIRRQAYEQKMAAQLCLWNVHVQKLDARAGRVLHDRKRVIRTEGVKRALDDAWMAFFALQATRGQERWQDMRQHLESLWKEVEMSLHSVHQALR
jgi:hypothetical protein